MSTLAQREGKFCQLSDLLLIKCDLLDKYCLSLLHFWLKTSFSLKEVARHKALKVELRIPVRCPAAISKPGEETQMGWVIKEVETWPWCHQAGSVRLPEEDWIWRHSGHWGQKETRCKGHVTKLSGLIWGACKGRWEVGKVNRSQWEVRMKVGLGCSDKEFAFCLICVCIWDKAVSSDHSGKRLRIS